MSFYISGPVQNDPNVIKQRFTDYITTYGPPGFVLQPGDPIDLFSESAALEAASQADVANALLDDAFRYLGLIARTPPIDAVPATATATFTVQDTTGYTIPGGGTIIGLADSTGTLQAFDLLADVIVPAGSTTGTGTVQAEQPGVIANGLSGGCQLLQAPAFVTAASLASSTGGVDAELQSVYMDRLAETFTLLTPIPVLAPNFAVLARSVAGVFRASAVDLLKPGSPYDTSAEATGQEKNVTVAVADVNGQPVGATIRGNVQTYLQGLREQNFKVWVVDPQYTTIDVAATVYAWPGWSTVDVQTRVIAAIQSLLSPANWGTDPTGNAARWMNDPTLRPGLIQQAIMTVQGVRYTDPQPVFGVHGTSMLGTPTGLAVAAVAGGGTFAAGTYYWKITGLGSEGETLASSEVSAAIALNGHGNLTWTALTGATGYKVYRASSTGAENVSPALVATVGAVTAYTDTGTATTAGAVPTVNTAQTLSTADVTLGSGSAVPALPTAGTISVTVNSTTP